MRLIQIQNRDVFFNTDNASIFYIAKTEDEYGEIYMVCVGNKSLKTDDDAILGSYRTYDQAWAVLNKMFKHLLNEGRLYVMP